MVFASGKLETNNLSTGLFRSSTPTAIPKTSWSDISNFDIDDNAIVTRKGYTQSNTAALNAGAYPGCLQLGYSDTQRVHYLKATGGDFGPTSGTDTDWAMYFYTKEIASTTERRDIINIQDDSGNSLVEVFWYIDNQLHFRFRPHSSHSWTDFWGDPANNVDRTGNTSFLFGVTLGITASLLTVSLFDSGGLADSTTVSTTANFATFDTLIVGNDSNTTYPDTDWTNSSNFALNSYFGELIITKNEQFRGGNYKTSFNVIPPGDETPTASRIAYYPLQKDLKDAWAINPSFGSGRWKTGSGLSSYSVEDSTLKNSRDLLFNTKSWNVNTFDVDGHLFGQTASLKPAVRDYMTGQGAKYTWTMDLLPIRNGASTTKYQILTATTAGPHIEYMRSTAGKTFVRFGHLFNSSNDPEISYTLDNNYSSKLNFQYTHGGTSASTVSLKIFHDTMLVSSTVSTLTSSTAPDALGNLILGQANTSSVSVDFFMSGLLLHNTDAGTAWGNRPQEGFETITTYTANLQQQITAAGGGSLGRFIVNRGGGPDPVMIASQEVEKKGVAEAYSIFDLPKFSNVKAGYLFTETTGYDTASDSTPHGVITNVFSSSTTDGTDFILKNNSTPIWITDRKSVGIVTPEHLDEVFEDTVDGVYGFIPANPTLKKRLLISRNSHIIDDSGVTFSLGDTYKYDARLANTMRGFMYGNSFYFHSADYFLRFNGNDVRPVEIIHPSIPLSLTNDDSPSTGLNGVYKYSYTYTDKSGTESYPALPKTVTVSTGTVAVSLNSKITDNSFLNEQIKFINIYRNKGGTTSTSLSRDADRSLYLLKKIPLSAVKANATGTLFTDTTADSALGGNPPQPDFADAIPPSRYSTIFKDSVVYTGIDNAPNHYFQSVPQVPGIIGVPGFDEFLTEDGEHNTAIASVGTGFIVFKRTSRKFIRGSIGGENYEYTNGGCVAHDSLVTIGTNVIGLGQNGFFKTDGHRYQDITDIIQSGRTVSSVRSDFEGWSSTVREAAQATYHQPTGRYVCFVNDKFYIFDTRYDVWMKYEDMVGRPLAFDGDFYLYKKGWFYKESTSQTYVGTTRVMHSVASGTTGRIVVTSTTALPMTKFYGLPAYVGTTFYWTSSITKSSGGNDYTIVLDTQANFTNATKMSLGVVNAYADTKFFDAKTPNRNKMFKKLVSEHDNKTDGEIKIGLARNSADFDKTYDHFVADTDVEKINTVLRVRSENMSVRFKVEDGKKHKLRNYTIIYEQESIE